MIKNCDMAILDILEGAGKLPDDEVLVRLLLGREKDTRRVEGIMRGIDGQFDLDEDYEDDDGMVA